jgi:hypothetical protein
MFNNLQKMVCKILPKVKMKWNETSLRKIVRASIFANLSGGLEPTLRVILGFTWIVDRSVNERLHYLLRTINYEESLKVNGVNSPFIKSSHSRWRMKEVGHGQFVFALDKSSKVNHVNKSVTAWSSSVNYGCFFCLLSGWFEMEEQPHTIGPSFF